MPRRGRGGPRRGSPGKPYPNRRDLAQNAQPIRAAPGQPFGVRGQQEASQRAIPLPRSSPAMVLPGSAGALDRPTERPDEPLTAGLPVGPGPGPEALRSVPDPNRPPPNPDLGAIVRVLPVLELLASQPGASVVSRNFVRRLRGGVPFEQF